MLNCIAKEKVREPHQDELVLFPYRSHSISILGEILVYPSYVSQSHVALATARLRMHRGAAIKPHLHLIFSIELVEVHKQHFSLFDNW